MKKKISFHNMPHSDPLEKHANEKLEKISNILKGEENVSPLHVELWLKANKQHPHHAVELHLKTPHLDLNTHDEGTDMYVVLDNTIDKMIALLKKEREKTRDKNRKVETEKSKFGSDKYKL
jgi:ribosomal subunit interface protein